MQRVLLTLCLVLAGTSGTLNGAAQLSWHQDSGFRWAELPVPPTGKTGFKLLSPDETGITFTNTLDTLEGEANRVLFNGSGVAVGDFDNDGLPDIFFCSLNGHNALYKNLGGMKFKDVTAGSGIVCSNQFCRGAVFADINGDGFLDLLVATTGSGVLCFLNDGHGKFSDITSSAGTATRFGSITMALADVDGNGALDLYVANNRTDDIRDHGQVDLQMVNGKLAIPPALQNRLVLINGKLFEYGEPDILYLNDGHGHFSPVSWTGGSFLDAAGNPLTGPPLDWGLTATFRDINGDGFPDLYVCNDYWTPDRIWLNDGQGHFRAADNLAIRHTSASSMGVDFADLTRSGHLDLFVVDMLSRDLRLRKRQMFAQTPTVSPVGLIDNRPQIMRNTLLANRGDGTFAEIADYAGLSASDWSWSPIFLDVDLDGYEDILIGAGHTRDVQDLDAQAQIRANSRARGQIANIPDPQARREAFIQLKLQNARFYPALDMPIVAFHNLGHYRFQESTDAWGTGDLGVHHAMALADLDGDGALDLIVNNLGSAAGIYRNETSAPRVAVRLRGLPPNTQAIGAQIRFLGGTVQMQSQEVICGGRYMAGSDTLAVFAPGNVTHGMTIEVRWRDGKQSVVHEVKANRIYEIDERSIDARQAPIARKPAETPMFEDVSGVLNHSHHEDDFNDFERQPLLPRKLSQLGPGVAWADLDGDGFDDLVVGSGKGGQMAVFHNNRHGGFERMTGPAFEKQSSRDQTGIVVWQETGRAPTVLAGSANYEEDPPGPSGVQEFDTRTGLISEVLTNQDSSAGPLALGELRGDGHLELFVGGRVIPARYPEAASSRLYRRRGADWEADEENTRAVEKVGLVSGAVWSDLDGDGFPELVLACEWGPIRVFKNNAGKLIEETHALGLDKYIGWWNGVTTGDLRGNGRMDIVASNWGLNSPYHPTPEHPVSLYYGDLAARGTVDLIEAEYDPALNADAPRRMRNLVAAALPDLPLRFPTQKAFSLATIRDVLGQSQSLARKLEANTLASTVFLNQGPRFEPVPLPAEAQYSPAFSAVVADFDGDGHEDLFLSQNFFPNEVEVPRCDAGRGLLLLGDGTGTLRPIAGQVSGIKVYGEQRGAAVADFDQDGRADLVVTQNGAVTRLFHNRAAKPGLRVRLAGPPGNPTGIGAQVRLLFGDELGPIREIHAGSGYWSQDSPVIVLATPKVPSKVWTRWPGGRVTAVQIPPSAHEITVPLPESR